MQYIFSLKARKVTPANMVKFLLQCNWG